jgi:Lrp/AsnC family leucine-responsive transcriptional regulator
MSQKASIDAVDAAIITLLQEEGRRSYADMAAAVGISAPSIHERVRKLEARGVIEGFSVDVDPRAVGLGVLAFTWVTQAPGTAGRDLTDAFERITEIEECHHVAGEADYLLKIRSRDTEHLASIVRRLQEVEHVFTTRTDIAFSTAFERRPTVVAPDDREAAR